MDNRWTQAGLENAIDQWATHYGNPLAVRIYSARLLGADPGLVLHGGGNVSIKRTARDLFDQEVDVIHVKASGSDMSRLDAGRLPALRLDGLRRLRGLPDLTDDQMVNQIRLQLFDSTAPMPSIETLLHAFLPHKFIDHTHADAVLALTNQHTGETLVREALGDQVAYIPYVRPGFALARAVADVVDARPGLEGVVLLFHGLITFADDAQTSYDRHIALVSACENYIAAKTAGRRLTAAYSVARAPALLATHVAPVLRGLLAMPTGDEDSPHRPPILEWRGGDDMLEFANSAEAAELCSAGALTGDHVIHTKPHSLWLSGLEWADEEKLRERLTAEIEAFRNRYQSYLETHAAAPDLVDLAPRVLFVPGVGLLAWGPTKSAALVTADIAEHTAQTKTQARLIGAYASLSDDHLFDMEFRMIQRAKLGTRADRPLDGQVVVVSGAAGAIGTAVAASCVDAGAHVALTDIEEVRLARLVEYINEQYGPGRAAAVAMDVTDESSVREGFDQIIRGYGGIDTVVPNAGIAHVAPMDELTLGDFHRVMEVNAVGSFLFMREGIRVLKRQNIGGQIVVIASKNVFAPGRDFAAYSASKSAAHQLGKVAALELAPWNIRVNMINPDAVFGDTDAPSGLWETIAASRARSRNLKVEDLPDFYRQRNLLKARIHGRHVGAAVVFFASRQTPTTGATLPVDGGILEAFPR